jgi:hypothetical protein
LSELGKGTEFVIQIPLWQDIKDWDSHNFKLGAF